MRVLNTGTGNDDGSQRVFLDLSAESPKQRTAIVAALGEKGWSYGFSTYESFEVIVWKAAEHGINTALEAQTAVTELVSNAIA